MAARPAVTAYVGVGANLGQPLVAVRQAMDDLAVSEGIAVKRRSSLYRSAPLAATGPDFVNAVVEVSTTLSAPALLRRLQQLEQRAGRTRPFVNAPRTLDLDLLLYGDAVMQSAALVLPHPRMQERAFVLVPLAEIAPHRVSAAQLHTVQCQRIERL